MELSEHEMMIGYEPSVVDGQTENGERIFGNDNIKIRRLSPHVGLLM